MAASLGNVLAQLQRWASPSLGEISDAVLLERFIHGRDESAFTALVARHGGMVLRSCRRVLGDAHEAEDAFQAVFLILARKAHTLRQPAALPGYLHSVARRVALKARRSDKRTACRATGAPTVATCLPDPHPDPLTQLTARELLNILDEEVGRLPSVQRAAVILCCLEGRSREEAAQLLGWTPGAVKGHLQRGRQRLQDRLAHRGIALSTVLALISVAPGEAAPALLLRNTVTAVLRGGIGSAVSTLAHSALQTMFLTKFATVTAAVLTIALAAAGTIAVISRGPAEIPEGQERGRPTRQDSGRDARAPAPRTDALGDPLPQGAIARLGTVRLRHGDDIAMVRFTPDSKRLISQGGDGLRVWDAVSGKELRHLAALGGRSDLSPDGKFIAGTKPGFGPIELWDVENGKKIAVLGEKCFAPIRFSPDGKLLATLATGNNVEIWQVDTRKKLRSWKVPAKHVGSLAFSPDSRRLFSNGFFDMVRVWDVATGRELYDFLPLASAGQIVLPFSPALSPDSKFVALIEGNSKQVSPSGKIAWKARISLRDLATQKHVHELTCPALEIDGQSLPFHAVTFTPDSKYLLASGPDRKIVFWDVKTGKELRRIAVEELPGSITLSPDGKKLAVVMAFGTAIRILDVESGQATMPAGGHLMEITAAALMPDGRTAVTGSPLGPIFVWDAATGRLQRRLENPHQLLDTLQLSGDGQTLITSGWDKTVRVWDVATGTERRRLTVERGHNNTRKAEEMANCWLVVAPDGKALAAMGADKTIRILDVATSAERQHFQGPEKLLGMGWTPDGRSLIVWSGDLKVRIWDTATARKLREFSLAQDTESDGGRYVHHNLALSHDGQLLAMAFAIENGELGLLASSLILKDLATGRVIHRIGGLPVGPGCVAFSPDDRMLAWAGSYDPSIRLFETASGRERRRLVGHRGRITALVFSADGRRLLSGCNDTTALVWDLSAHAPPLPVHAANLQALWNDLASADAARAYRAIQKLAVSPSLAIPFMRNRLHTIAAVEDKPLVRLLADLDSDAFATREKATVELTNLGELALPAYRKALQSKPSLESRRRMEALLEKAHTAYWDVSGERLRVLRAIETLELAGTQEARELLATLATGAEGARQTAEAKAALQRLASRERVSSP